MSAGISVAEAYERCESMTREKAANFYYGIRLLPRERRLAMCAVYAFARRVDDIGDGTLAPAEKLLRLDGESRALAEREPPGVRAASSDAVMVALADARERFALPDGALEELIEGVRMDVEGITYERFEDLVLYCRRVAGAIGRVCLAIFGTPGARPAARADAEQLADDLGVAMQLTNILRDLREDAENGRVYLPAEDLRRFGVVAPGQEPSAAGVLAQIARGAGRADAGPAERDPAEPLEQLVRFEADRAEAWFESGARLVPLLDRRSAACVLAMSGIYRRLLARVEGRPELALRERVSLPTREKAWVAARSLLGGRA